ncbi:hypothetical protein I4F81_008891 [Pyropia yezoensis]|uniref:Uncharacterized protein n=1 Tax=Pyropia yezoensis TaxID=2788 RepID=A0ACC3C7V0_PYRYE|nr:hypothetical protein I4F81_008891 [Neopyropia yezoensis]
MRLLKGSARATLILDGCKRSNNTHVLGAVVGIAGERLVLYSEDDGHPHDGIFTAAAIADFIDRLAGEGEIRVGGVCTDDAGQCGLARRILALRCPALIFLRWAPEVHPLFLPAFSLHPRYMEAARKLVRQDGSTTPLALVSAPRLANASAGYFAKWFSGESSRADAIVPQTFEFLTGDVTSKFCTPSLQDGQTYGSAGWTWYKFWRFLEMGGACPELSMLALALLECKPQTASVERQFKEHAAQQTKARNRMTLSTLDMITAVQLGCERAAANGAGGPRPSINRVLDPTARSRENGRPGGGPAGEASSVPATASGGGGTEDDDSDEAGSSGGPATIQDWAAVLQDLMEDHGDAAGRPSGSAAEPLLFDFRVPAVAELACPLPAQDVAGYPQEVLRRLSNFRAAKL